jgi:regulator of sigma E protease
LTTILAAIVVLSLLTLVHEFGHLVFAKLAGLHVEEFGLGFPPRLLTLGSHGGTEYTLNLIAFGAFVRLSEDEGIGSRFSDQEKRVRAMFLVGGPLLNLLLSMALFGVCFATGWPEAHDRAVGVDKVQSGSVAAAVGFQPGDLILAANEREVASVLELIVYARSVHGDIRAVTLLRQGLIFSLTLPPGRPWFVQPLTRGVLLRNDAGWVEVVPYPLPTAIRKATAAALSSVWALLSLPLRVLAGEVPLDLVRPVGPVGIAQLTGHAAQQVVTSGWWFPLVQLTASLSAALAATNLLPLPGFDGGRLLFIGLEALRGKRLAVERENALHWVGLILMILLILVVSYYDITMPYPFGR